MVVISWSEKDKKDEEDKLGFGTPQIKSVQDSWNPSDSPLSENKDDRVDDTNYFLTEDYQNRENERIAQEQQRIAQENAERAAAAQAFAAQQQSQQQSQQQEVQAPNTGNVDKRIQDETDYINNKVTQERKNWENSQGWLEKVLGINKFDENASMARARSSAANAFTNWDNQADISRSQQLARGAVNIANNQQVDTSLVGAIGSVFTPVSNVLAPLTNTAKNFGANKEAVYQFLNEGMKKGVFTFEEAQDFLAKEGLDNDLSGSQYIMDAETGEYRRMTAAEGVNKFTSQISKPLTQAGGIIGESGRQLADGALGEDETPEDFNWSDPKEYLRFGMTLLPGMAEGLSENPEKIVLGVTQLAEGDLMKGAANLVDAGIDVAGLFMGGSGTLLKGATGQAVKRHGVKAVVKELAKDIGQEAAEEFIQSIAGDVAETGDLGSIDLGKAVESAALGGLGGGLMSGAGQGLNYAVNRANPNLSINQESSIDNSVQAGVGETGKEKLVSPVGGESYNALLDTLRDVESNRTKIPQIEEKIATRSQYTGNPNATEFNLRKKLAEDIRKRPDLEGLLRKRFNLTMERVRELQDGTDSYGAELQEAKKIVEESEQRHSQKTTPLDDAISEVEDNNELAVESAKQAAQEAPKAEISEDTPASRKIEANQLETKLAKGEMTVDEVKQAKNEARLKAESSSTDIEMDAFAEASSDLNKKKSAVENVITSVSQDPASSVRAKLAKIAEMPAGTSDVSIGEILDNVKKITPGQRTNIIKDIEKLEGLTKEYNDIQAQNAAVAKRSGVGSLDPELSKKRSKVARDRGIISKRITQRVRALESKNGGLATKAVNTLTSATNYRKANMLTSLPSIERNIMQEVTANLIMGAKHPIKSYEGIRRQHLTGELKKIKENGKNVPKTRNVADWASHAMATVLEATYTVTSSLVEQRKDAFRYQIAETALKMDGKNPTKAEVRKLAGAMGNNMELAVITFAGIDNGMSNRYQADRVRKAMTEFMKDGSPKAMAEFTKNVEKQSNMIKKISEVAARDGSNGAKLSAVVLSNLFPFISTPTNLAKTGFYNLTNVKAQSVIDSIGQDVRSHPENIANILKNKAGQIGTVAAISGMIDAGIIASNDDEEVDKPKGIYINLGGGRYMPLRALSIELPIATIFAAKSIMNDMSKGKDVLGDYSKYLGYITNSLPYFYEYDTLTGLANEIMGKDNKEDSSDKNYAKKAYLLNLAKSLTPFSNNGILPYVEGKQGKSTNAKSVYDKDSMGKWFENIMKNSYNIDRDSLNDSRDASGLVRTMDSQGVIINKHINDADSKKWNQDIEDRFKYAKDNGIFKDKNEAWDTYGDSRLSTVRSQIVFFDNDGSKDGVKTSTKAGLLAEHDELYDLSQQIREGIFGDKGGELLNIKGNPLYSNASKPTKGGDKNSSMPINMLSINNAIAQQGMSQELNDRMRALGDENQSLYPRFKNKELTYEQYRAKMDANNAEIKQIVQSTEAGRKLMDFYTNLDESGFFAKGGYGSTKSGQVYLWNALDAMLDKKGKTPAAEWSTNTGNSGFGSGKKGGSSKAFGSTFKPKHNIEGMKSPVKDRKMDNVKIAQYTPVKAKVKLSSQVKKDKSQRYEDRSF